MLTIDCWSVVHCRFKCVERMNEAISWRETGLSELLVTKLEFVRDGHQFCISINSSLASIMVERSTGTETIPPYIIP